MKKLIFLIFLLMSVSVFPACAKGVESCPAEGPTLGTESFSSGEAASGNMITSDMLGQGLYDALEKEWERWEEKDEMERMLSSHIPGLCYKSFDTLEECEEFLGFPLDNPLEDGGFQKASYVGLPIDEVDASHVYISFYGENAEQVQWIFVDSGYRNEDVRITVSAQIYVDTPAEETDTEELAITEDSGGQYVANSVTIVQGPAIYNIRVIGDPNHKKEVKETLEKVISRFSPS